jgi:protein TonB
MFEQTFVNSQARTRKPWTVGASLAIQSLLVLTGLLVPLLHIARLEPPPRDLPLFVMLKPVTEMPPPAHKVSAAQTTPRVFHSPLAAPTHIPDRIVMAPDAPEPPMLAWVGDSGALSRSAAVPGLPLNGISQPPPRPPEPNPDRLASPREPLRVSSGVQQANLIYAPKPVYPQLAKSARVQGTIKLQAIIAVDGSIRNLRVIGGPPLLVNAAIDAVRRWQYKPTMLNGSPVEVLTEIDVNFSLN